MDSSECYVQSRIHGTHLLLGYVPIKYKLSTSVRVLKNCAHIFQVCFEDVITDGAPDIFLDDVMAWCTLP
jgi:hypothetical protein